MAFTVNTPQIASISPVSGAAGTSVTFTGSGFGTTQGSVTLGSMAGQVQEWSDTQVTASVASGAVSGIARIQRSDGLWSNALGFTVPVAGGGGGGAATQVVPSLLNMAVGDTHTLQALNAAGQVGDGADVDDQRRDGGEPVDGRSAGADGAGAGARDDQGGRRVGGRDGVGRGAAGGGDDMEQPGERVAVSNTLCRRCRARTGWRTCSRFRRTGRCRRSPATGRWGGRRM